MGEHIVIVFAIDGQQIKQVEGHRLLPGLTGFDLRRHIHIAPCGIGHGAVQKQIDLIEAFIVARFIQWLGRHRRIRQVGRHFVKQIA